MSSKCPKTGLNSPRQRTKAQIQTRSRHRKTQTPRKRISLIQKSAASSNLAQPQTPDLNDHKKQKDQAMTPCSSSATEHFHSRSRSRKNSKTIQVLQNPCPVDPLSATEKTSGRELTVNGETLKKEIIQGFVVDEWLDLGPSQHKDGHSPTVPEQAVDIKHSPTTTVPDSDVPRRKCKRTGQLSLDSAVDVASEKDGLNKTTGLQDNRKSLHQSHDVSYADQHAANTQQYTRQAFTYPHEQTGLDPSVTVPSFWPQHISHATGSYNFQLAPYPLVMHQPRSQREHWDNIGFNSPSANHNTLLPNVFPLGIGSRFGEAGPSQNTGQCSARTPLTTDSATPSMMLNSNETAAAAPGRCSNAIHTSNISDGLRGATIISGIQYPGVIYPDHFIHQNAVQSQGMVFVQPHPYFLQPMPYPSVFPNIGFSQVHAREMNPVAKAPLKENLQTEPKCGSGGTSLSRSEVTETLDHLPNRVQVIVPQPLRHVPRAAGQADFIDPTKIKFGIDDEGTDDEIARLKENIDDTSDEEWQPTKWSVRRKNLVEKVTEKTSATQWDVKQSEPYGKKTPKANGSKRENVACSTCGKHFRNEYHLRRHEISHSEVRPHSCHVCSKRFKQKAHLVGHMSVHERPQVQTENSTVRKKRALVKCPGRPRKSYTEKDLSCKECGKCFKTIYRLKRHEQSHTDIRPFSCKICGKGFKQTGHRNEHEANHEKGKKRFLCNMCGVIFRCRSSFNNHIKSHSIEKLRLQQTKETSECLQTGYDCPYCPEKFATAQALNNHLETHVEVKHRRHVQPYSCDVCKRAFTYRHNLLKHKLIHKAPEQFAQYYKEKIEAHVASGKPSFKCFVCSKVFIRKETLAKHFKIHSGTKPFKCTICIREFTQNVHLKVHMRKHTGSRPFQCKECGKGFIDSTSLAKHIEYEACNAENALYRCKVCEKRHYYLGSIKQHVRKEHGVVDATKMEAFILKFERSGKRKISREGEKYVCKICCWNFTEKCNLVRHVKRKHMALVELLKSEHRDEHLKTPLNVAESINNGRSISESMSSKSMDIVENKALGDKESRRLLIDECTTGPHTQNCTPGSVESINPKPIYPGVSLKENNDSRSGLDSLVEESDSSLSVSIDNEKRDDPNKAELSEGFEHEDGSEPCYQDVSKRECGEEDGTASSDVENDALESKTSVDKNKDLTSDMNFLYHIGLIVSSKPVNSKAVSRTRMRLRSHRKTKTGEVSPLKEFEPECHSPVGKLCGGEIKRDLFLLEPKQDGFSLVSEKVHKIPDLMSGFPLVSDISDLMSGSEKVQKSSDLMGSVDVMESTDTQFREERDKGNLTLNQECSDLTQDNHLSTGELEMAKCPTKETDKKIVDGPRGVELAPRYCHTPLCPERKDKLSLDKSTCTANDCTTSHSAFQLVAPRTFGAAKGDDADLPKCSDKVNSFIEMPTSSSESPTQPHAMAMSVALSSVTSSGTMRLISKYPSPDQHLPDSMSSSRSLTNESPKSAVQEMSAVCCKPSKTCIALNSNNISVNGEAGDANAVRSKCCNSLTRENFILQEQSSDVKKLSLPLSFHEICVNKAEETNGNISKHDECSPNVASLNVASLNVASSNVASSNVAKPNMAYSNETIPNETNPNFENACGSETSKLSEEFSHQPLSSVDNITLDLGHRQLESPRSRLHDEPLELIRTPGNHDEYESCPTESHLKCLGLLACRDSKEIESRSHPVETLYATFKPWLESLVCSSRGRRAKFKATADRGAPSSNERDEQRQTGTSNDFNCETEPSSRWRHKIKSRETPKHEPSIMRRKREMCGVAGTLAGDTTAACDHIHLETDSIQLMAAGELPASAALVKAIASSGHNVWTQRCQNASEILSRDEESAPVIMCGAELPHNFALRHQLQNVSKSTALSRSSVLSAAVTSTSPTAAARSVVTASVSKTSTPPTTPDSTTRSRHQFPCLVCAKVFNARHQLKRHELTHTDKRPYCCDECGRAFRQKVHLTDHQKRHQGHRPFLCTGCGKRFVLKNEMNQHIKNHCKGTAVVSKALTTGTTKPIFTISLQELTPLLTGKSAHHNDDVITLAHVEEGLDYRQGRVVYARQGVAETTGLKNQDNVTSSSNVQLEVKAEPEMAISSYGDMLDLKCEPISFGGEVVTPNNGQDGGMETSSDRENDEKRRGDGLRVCLGESGRSCVCKHVRKKEQLETERAGE